MEKATNIVFICTGNIFRSMTAEYALRAALDYNAIHSVSSAGLIDAPHEVLPFVRDHLLRHAIDISGHQPRKLTSTILGTADLAVALGEDHSTAVQQEFDRAIPLFSQVAFGTREPLRDVWEVIPDWRKNEAEAEAYIRLLMDKIFDAMPQFIERMNGFRERSLKVGR